MKVNSGEIEACTSCTVLTAKLVMNVLRWGMGGQAHNRVTAV